MVFSSSRLRIHPVSFCALRGTTVASLPFRYSSIQKIKYLLFIYYAVKNSTVIVVECIVQKRENSCYSSVARLPFRYSSIQK